METLMKDRNQTVEFSLNVLKLPSCPGLGWVKFPVINRSTMLIFKSFRRPYPLAKMDWKGIKKIKATEWDASEIKPKKERRYKY